MKIITHPNDLLRRKAIDVDLEDTDGWQIWALLIDMVSCIASNGGIGLAACQVGSDKNLFVYRSKSGQILSIINPKVLARSGKYRSRGEQCLSIPGIKRDIKRSKMIKIEYVDNFGEECILKSQNFEAAVIQHELDHLNGKLIIDRD